MADLATLKAAYAAIVESPEYLQNIGWGEPRSGHPEGSIALHIQELEDNLCIIAEDIEPEDYWRIKIMIHVHDTFKPETVPGTSHGELAAKFLAKFLPDESDMIAMVANHDALYNIWRLRQKSGLDCEEAITELHGKVKDWNLFTVFMLVDGLTFGKDPRPLNWCVQLLEDRKYVMSRIAPLKDRIAEEMIQRAPCI